MTPRLLNVIEGRQVLTLETFLVVWSNSINPDVKFIGMYEHPTKLFITWPMCSVVEVSASCVKGSIHKEDTLPSELKQ